MAYTTPRTWSTGELVTAAMLNAQISGNVEYLKDALDNPSTGHDHDGVDSKQIAWGSLPSATFVTWISGAQAVSMSYEGTAGRPHPNGYAEGPSNDAYEMLFAFPLPQQWAGRSVTITGIEMYCYTAAKGYYFDAVYLRRSDLDGTYTDDVSYTTDIGNGSSGDTQATIHSGAVVLADYPYMLVVKCAGGGAYGSYRVYGFKVTWTV